MRNASYFYFLIIWSILLMSGSLESPVCGGYYTAPRNGCYVFLTVVPPTGVWPIHGALFIIASIFLMTFPSLCFYEIHCCPPSKFFCSPSSSTLGNTILEKFEDSGEISEIYLPKRIFEFFLVPRCGGVVLVERHTQHNYFDTKHKKRNKSGVFRVDAFSLQERRLLLVLF